jgi:hypothetical protein
MKFYFADFQSFVGLCPTNLVGKYNLFFAAPVKDSENHLETDLTRRNNNISMRRNATLQPETQFDHLQPELANLTWHLEA